MRQVGFLAAAGLEALKLVDRLEEDHKNARYLAESLNELPGLSVDLKKVQTNIVIVDITGTGKNSAEFVREAASRGVGCTGFGPHLVRFVAHKDVSRADIENVVKIVGNMLS